MPVPLAPTPPAPSRTSLRRRGDGRAPTSHRPRRGRVSAWSRRHDLGIYVVLAFLLSWLPWPLVALNPNSSPMVPFGPLIAALAVAALTGGWTALGQLSAQLVRWRRPTRWYAAALLGPVAITGLAAALTLALGGSGTFHPRPAGDQVAATFVSTLVLVGIFEEVGWRGYALPRLQRRMSGLRAALVLGVVWACWHLPELVSDPTRQRPALPFVVLVLAQSVVLSWLYNSTAGALPTVIISHATLDTAVRFVLPGFAGGSYELVWWCHAVLWTAVAVGVVTSSGRGLGRGPSSAGDDAGRQ